MTGEAQSPFYLTVSKGSVDDPSAFGGVEVSATTRVYASRKDARAALEAEATLATAHCLLGRSTGTAKKSTATDPKRPETVRAFVDTLDFQGPTGTMEIVFVQRGRSLAKLIVVGINTPSRPLALALEQTLAARLR